MGIYRVTRLEDLFEAVLNENIAVNISCESSLQENVQKSIIAPDGGGKGTINILYDGLSRTGHPLRVKIVGHKPSGGDLEIPINPNTKKAEIRSKLIPAKKSHAVEAMVYTAVGIGLEMFDDIKKYYGYIDKDGRHPGDASKKENIENTLNKIAKKTPNDMKKILSKGKKATIWLD